MVTWQGFRNGVSTHFKNNWVKYALGVPAAVALVAYCYGGSKAQGDKLTPSGRGPTGAVTDTAKVVGEGGKVTTYQFQDGAEKKFYATAGPVIEGCGDYEQARRVRASFLQAASSAGADDTIITPAEAACLMPVCTDQSEQQLDIDKVNELRAALHLPPMAKPVAQASKSAAQPAGKTAKTTDASKASPADQKAEPENPAEAEAGNTSYAIVEDKNLERVTYTMDFQYRTSNWGSSKNPVVRYHFHGGAEQLFETSFITMFAHNNNKGNDEQRLRHAFARACDAQGKGEDMHIYLADVKALAGRNQPELEKLLHLYVQQEQDYLPPVQRPYKK